MENTVKLGIRAIYTALRPSEQRVADYILAYTGRAEELLIEEMARQCGVSQPTVLRFVKAAGYKGFRDFKYALVQEDAKRPPGPQDAINLYGFRLTKQDKLEDIPGKIVATSLEMLEETLKCIPVKAYKRAVEAICQAENIVIYSVENSICTASDLLTKLISRYADILLYASNRQFLYGDTIFSRISQLALVDMLYAGVLNRDYDRLSKKLNKTSEIVARRAYGENEEVL